MAQQYSQHVEGKKNYHVQPTGTAKITADAHSKPESLQLFASCFCPFVHRAWVALELSGLDYQVIEVDVYKKPKELLDVNRKGLVPALAIVDDKGHKKALAESLVIMDFIEELSARKQPAKRKPLLPEDPYARAVIRLQIDHIGKTIIPSFYKYLQAQEEEQQVAGAKAFAQGLLDLIAMFEEAEKQGLRLGLFGGSEISMSEVAVAPWVFRATNVLKHYRGYSAPQSEAYRGWENKLLAHSAVLSTSSDEELYLDS